LDTRRRAGLPGSRYDVASHVGAESTRRLNPCEGCPYTATRWQREALHNRTSQRRYEVQRTRVAEAFIFERSIEQSVYERQRDKVQQELMIAELELDDARMDQWDVEGVLAFAERLITNVGSIWLEATLSQRQQIQRAEWLASPPGTGECWTVRV
jgi:hypothetical protein